jgi:hypothetical protein
MTILKSSPSGPSLKGNPGDVATCLGGDKWGAAPLPVPPVSTEYLAVLTGVLAGSLNPGSLLNLTAQQNNIGQITLPSQFRIDVDGVYLITVTGQAIGASSCRINSQPAGYNGTIGGCDTTSLNGGLGGTAMIVVDAAAPADDRTIYVGGTSAALGANWNGVFVLITRVGPRV